MKIINYKKSKSNQYIITFDNTLDVKLYDDVIVKYNLLVNKEMDEVKFKEITDYNDSLDSYYKSIKYINTKLRSELEIKKYLEKYYYENSTIDNTILKLKKDGYLNNDLYIKSYINDQVNLSLNGPYKITKSLIKLGFKEENINNYLDTINDNVWVEKVNKIISKKAKTMKYPESILKAKLSSYLYELGYDSNISSDAISKLDIPLNASLLKKEINNYKNKLKKKYKEEELIYQLRNKLYQKGYKIEDINKYI